MSLVRYASVVAMAASGVAIICLSPIFIPVMAASAAVFVWVWVVSPNRNRPWGLMTTIEVLTCHPQIKPFVIPYKCELLEAACQLQREIDFDRLRPSGLLPQIEAEGRKIVNSDYVENVTTHKAIVADLLAMKKALIALADNDPVIEADLGLLMDVLINMSEEELVHNCSGKYLKVYQKKADWSYIVYLYFANTNTHELKYTRHAVMCLTSLVNKEQETATLLKK